MKFSFDIHHSLFDILRFMKTNLNTTCYKCEINSQLCGSRI
jgi:hypothetical protein